jgi:hypothetical protein
MYRPALEGFAKVEIKGPRDWKAAWRTWNQRIVSDHSITLAEARSDLRLKQIADHHCPPSHDYSSSLLFRPSPTSQINYFSKEKKKNLIPR